MSVRHASEESVNNGNFPIDDLPDAPTIGTVAVSNTSTVTVPFTVVSGGRPTSYVVNSSPSISLTTTNTNSPLTVTTTSGTFISGSAYTFTITAINSTGASSPSAASNSVTPNP